MYLTKEPVKLDRAASSVNVAFVILTVLVIAVNFLEDIPLLIYYTINHLTLRLVL